VRFPHGHRSRWRAILGDSVTGLRTLWWYVMETAFLDLMPHTITVEPFLSRGEYGEPGYGAPTTHRALVTQRQKLVRSSDGRELLAQTVVNIAGPVTIGSQDRITLPDNTMPPVLAVQSFADETGSVHSVEVAF